jgi:hypothetical protein
VLLYSGYNAQPHIFAPLIHTDPEVRAVSRRPVLLVREIVGPPAAPKYRSSLPGQSCQPRNHLQFTDFRFDLKSVKTMNIFTKDEHSEHGSQTRE